MSRTGVVGRGPAVVVALAVSLLSMVTALVPPAAPAGADTVTGPDVSNFQHPNGAPIDWATVAGAGNRFTILKATGGPPPANVPVFINPYFAADWAGAGAAGLYRGAYHRAVPSLPLSSADDQAQVFFSVTGTMQGPRDLPPVLDIEDTGGLAPDVLVAWATRYLQAVQARTGRRPMIYTSRNFWATAMGGTTSLTRYPLWFARWTTADDPGALPGGWLGWELWQFSSTSTVAGIPAVVDLDRFCCGEIGLASESASRATSPELLLAEHLGDTRASVDVSLGVPPGGRVLMCDWDGDRVDTPAVVLNGVWHLTNRTSGGPATSVFGYGDPTDVPVCGDWNGDGIDTPGVVRRGVWYLTDVSGAATASRVFGYGDPGDIPVVGDWNGDGRDTPGVVRSGTWFVTNTTGKATADLRFPYGFAGDTPVVGDWNGDGTDTQGIVRGGVWHLTNTLGKSSADLPFPYGDLTDVPVAGDWNGDGASTVGVVRVTGQ